MNVVTRNKLAELLNITRQTLCLYLDNYRFGKYKVRHATDKIAYELSEGFIQEFYEYLLLKHRLTEAKIFKCAYGENAHLPTYKDFIEKRNEQMQRIEYVEIM